MLIATYLEVIFNPAGMGVLYLVPLSGMIALGSAIYLMAATKRLPNLLIALLSVLLTHGLVAGYTSVRQLGPGIVLSGFAVLQLIILVGLVWFSRSNRWAGGLLAWFALTYALVGYALAAFAFSHVVK